MKIAATVIAYQAEKFIGDLVRSLHGHIDVLCISIDQKSTDATKEAVQKAWDKLPAKTRFEVIFGEHNLQMPPAGWQERMKDGKVDPADIREDVGFSVVRNQALQLLPQDTDWFFWIDADDVFGADPGVTLKQLATEAAPDVSSIWMPYLYHRNDYGDVDTLFMRERLLRYDRGFVWKNLVHETCEARLGGRIISEGDPRNPANARMWVDHVNAPKRDPETSSGERNFELLRYQLALDPNDHRGVLYMAHQLFQAKRHIEAAEYYERYYNMQGNGDVAEEKYQALIWAARSQRFAGNLQASIRDATTALAMLPQYKDAYFEMGHTLGMQRQWTRAIEFVETGLNKQQLNAILITNPLDYDFNPYAILHVCYYQMRDYRKALDAVTHCLKYRPNDAELRFRGRFYLAAWNRANTINNLLAAVRHLIQTNEPLKAKKLLDAFPAGSDEETAQLAGARQEVSQRLAHLKSDAEYENFYFAEQPEIIKPKKESLEDAYVRRNYPRMAWVADQLLKYGCKRILEIGVGNAIASMYFANRGLQVVGIDVDPRRIKEANFAAAKLGFLKKRFSQQHEMRIPVLFKRGKPRKDLPVQFHWGKPGDIPKIAQELGPYDAVVAAEVIEHVEDEQAFLEMMESANASHWTEPDAEGKARPMPVPYIVLTTPDGAYRGPQELNPSHVQVWSRSEFETLIHKRGWLKESHLIQHPYGEQPNLGAVYQPYDALREDPRERPPVIFYCGPGLEPWTPEQVNTEGLGGSETAVVEVAKNIAGNGYRATVFAEAEGIWDGVRYRKFNKWNPGQTSWMFVSWRHPEVFDLQIAANIKVLWMHDTDAGPNITPARMKQVDFIMCLSEWHRNHLLEMYPFLGKPKCGLDEGEHIHNIERCYTQLLIVGNGIDPERFRGPAPEREPHRFIYTSSPDRGLEQALTYWPHIREKLPEAELHIFYGWDNYDRMGGDGAYKAKITKLADQPGVTWHGRIGQKALAQEMRKSSVWFYPGPHPFHETFCISALEAQAAGCVPVTRDNGALPEVNQHGIVAPNDHEAGQWVMDAVEATGYGTAKRQRMAEWAQRQTWGEVTKRMMTKAFQITKLLMELEAAHAKPESQEQPTPAE